MSEKSRDVAGVQALLKFVEETRGREVDGTAETVRRSGCSPTALSSFPTNDEVANKEIAEWLERRSSAKAVKRFLEELSEFEKRCAARSNSARAVEQRIADGLALIHSSRERLSNGSKLECKAMSQADAEYSLKRVSACWSSVTRDFAMTGFRYNGPRTYENMVEEGDRILLEMGIPSLHEPIY